jgi:hypothetical protein
MNQLYSGDNLQVLCASLAAKSVDLIHLRGGGGGVQSEGCDSSTTDAALKLKRQWIDITHPAIFADREG